MTETVNQPAEKPFYRSKKWWMAILGVLVPVLAQPLGLEPDKLMELLAPIVAYILGQGLADFAKNAPRSRS